MIEIKNLTKIYKSKHKIDCKALDNISFSLPDKGLVFIVGKSGSGKSTLLNMISGLDSFTSGDIIADGNSFNEMSKTDFDKYLSSYIGFVFQDYRLIDDFTIKQNIQIALDISGENNNISYYLDKVGLQGHEDRFPTELSGGQKQRVAIVRAIIKNPQIILADEPTGNLDNHNAWEIMALLEEINKRGTTVIVVTHNMDIVKEMNKRVITIRKGIVVEDSKMGCVVDED
jgi:ABC-type lipoprotein export system ATPase subunit